MLLSILLAASTVAETSPEKPFPEPMPVMMEACLANAVANDEVSETEDSWKYICGGAPAEALWNHLVALGIEPWEQTVSEGTWSSREFPMGGCFKRIKDPAGQPTNTGLSCTIWVPRK